MITAYLFQRGGDDNPANLVANEDKSFIGSYVQGMGFTFDDSDKDHVASSLSKMAELIRDNPSNADRIFPYLGGEEVNDDPEHKHHRYVINFEDFPLRREPRSPSWVAMLTTTGARSICRLALFRTTTQTRLRRIGRTW